MNQILTYLKSNLHLDITSYKINLNLINIKEKIMNNITFCTSNLICGAALGACTIGTVPGAVLGGVGFLAGKVIILTGLPKAIQNSLRSYNTDAIIIASAVAQVAAGSFLVASIIAATGLLTTSIPITAGFLGATFISAAFFDLLIFKELLQK